jgi:hypothetical protein
MALLRGPMDRLLALSLQENPAPRAAVSRAWEKRFEDGRRSVANPGSLKSDAGRSALVARGRRARPHEGGRVGRAVGAR